MTRLYLMRHGQTLFNTLNRIQGWCDSPLTEKGREQARQVRAYFEKHDIHLHIPEPEENRSFPDFRSRN